MSQLVCVRIYNGLRDKDIMWTPAAAWVRPQTVNKGLGINQDIKVYGWVTYKEGFRELSIPNTTFHYSRSCKLSNPTIASTSQQFNSRI